MFAARERSDAREAALPENAREIWFSMALLAALIARGRYVKEPGVVWSSRNALTSRLIVQSFIYWESLGALLRSTRYGACIETRGVNINFYMQKNPFNAFKARYLIVEAESVSPSEKPGALSAGEI